MQSIASLGDNTSVAEDPPIAQLPEHPLADLRELHTAIKELLLQLRHKLYAATDFSTERQFSALNTSVYTQARSLLAAVTLPLFHTANTLSHACLHNTARS